MRTKRRFRKTLVGLLAFVLATLSVPAQVKSEASLRVVVVDPTGAALVAATVYLKSVDGKEQTQPTNERGEATFLRLPLGAYQLRITAAGFITQEITDRSLKAGSNTHQVKLEIEGVKENVTVAQSERDKNLDPRGNAFSSVLTAAQIDALPDDPEEFEQALRNLAGPGATFRVNGFRGGKLPPKSQIREIRLRMNPYSADNHESNFISVDILTKPGISDWHGALGFGFRDESLNARNAVAPFRAPEQTRRFNFSLDGPLWKNHTSLFLNVDGYNAYDSKTIVAALPDGEYRDVARRPSKTLNLSARVEHALTKTHTLLGEYQRNANRLDNLGVGDFDLPERAYTNDTAEHLFRLADTGTLGKKLVNEFRLQSRWQEIDKSSASLAPTINVLNAFTGGGAQWQGGRNVREIEIADNVDVVIGRHSLRAGLLYEFGRYRSDENQNTRGTFVFPSLEDYEAGRPTTFSLRTGDPLVTFPQHQFGFYLQDDLKLSKSVSLSLGLRHEFQNDLDDRMNFAPRFGLAWSPFKNGKTTLRVGAGVFYNWLDSSVVEQTLRVDGVRQRDRIIQNPGYPNPLTGGTQTILPPSKTTLAEDLQMPSVRQFSIGLQRQMDGLGMLMVNYFHQRGVHQLRGHNINVPVNGVRPDPQFGNINQVESTAPSRTNGLSINLNIMKPQKRFFSAFNYFYSRTTNDADSPFSMPANNFDLGAERGPAASDIRHRFFAMLNYQLPGNLRVGSVIQYASAPPYTITTGFDDNGDTVSNDRPAGVGRNSERGDARFEVGLRLAYGFGFGKPKEATGGMGGPQIKVIRGDADVLGGMGGPSLTNKRFRGEWYVQAYNLLNNTNKTSFSGVQTSPYFGQATAALPARRIESGLRFSF